MTVLSAALPVVVAVSVFVATGGVRRLADAATPVAPPTLPPVGAFCDRVRRLRTVRRSPDHVADDLPDFVDLMAVAAASGATVRLALEAAVRHHDGHATEILRGVLEELALGARLSEALAEIIGGLDVRVADTLRPLVAVLVDCDHYGTPAAPALQRLADDLRLHRQRRAETRARRVPVRLLLPLVLCVLPAFALLTVAPLFAGMARDALADNNLPFEGTAP